MDLIASNPRVDAFKVTSKLFCLERRLKRPARVYVKGMIRDCFYVYVSHKHAVGALLVGGLNNVDSATTPCTRSQTG